MGESAMQTKDQRLNLRASQRQTERLRRAAEVERKTVSQFVLDSAMQQAEMVLADKRWFILGEDEFSRVEELLEEPVSMARLAKLVNRESPFGKEFSFDAG